MIKNIKKIAPVIVAAGVCAATLSGCNSNSNLNQYTKYYYAFGTQAELIVYSDFNSKSAQNKVIELAGEISSLIYSLEKSLSVSVEGSYIYKFNAARAGEAVELDKTSYELLTLAKNMTAQTYGYYNPGVYYSVDLYGFAPRASSDDKPYDREDATSQLPDEKYVSAFYELTQYFSQTELYEKDGKYIAEKPQNAYVEVDGARYELKVDLGGIGKGYAADKVSELIAEYGYEGGVFSFGSSSMSLKTTPSSNDGSFALTFKNPRGEGYYFSTRVKNSCVSTSGDFEQYYEIEGERYCHIINPYTGRPINSGILTATCIGGTAAENDARTTAICAMGLEKAIEYINSEDIKEADIKVAFVYKNSAGKLLVVTNIKEGEYTLLNTSQFTLASQINQNGDVVFTGEL